MDTTMLAALPASAWKLLAEFAACGQDSAPLRDASGLVRRIAASIQTHLACPWGMIVLYTVADSPVVAVWGLDEAQQQFLLAQNGQAAIPDSIEIPLEQQQTLAGRLILGRTPHLEAILVPEFVVALRRQLELLITLQLAEQRRTRELEQVHAISERLSAGLSLDATLDAFLDGLSPLAPFAGAQICLYDASNQALQVAITRGIPADLIAPAQGYLSPDGATGWIARSRRPLRLADAHQALVQPMVTRLADGTPVQSYFGVPLLAGEQLIGILELFSDRINAFAGADERLLLLAARSAAQAITNARRYAQANEHLQSRVQQLTALQRISRQLTATLSLDSILSFALKEALRATSATQGYIALRGGGKDDLEIEDAETGRLMGYIALHDDTSTGPFQVIAAAGYENGDRARIMGQPLSDGALAATQALARGEPVFVDELRSDDRLMGIGLPVASVLAMPIFYEDQIVGVVNLHSQTPHTFDHDALEFVRALTDQAALAIGNAQRYQNQVRQRELLQQRASMLNEVLSIGQALRADRSLAEVLEQIAFSIIDVARYRVVMFNLVDPDDPEMLRTIAGAGLPLADLERLRGVRWPMALARRFLDERFRIGRSFFVPTEAMQDITAGIDLNEFTSLSAADQRAASEWQIDDALFVPLYSTGAKLLGLLAVDDPYDRRRPSRRSVETLEIFADQAAIAIENFGLLREARNQAEQMTALYHVGAAIVSTLDLDDLLERVFKEIIAYVDTPSYTFVASYNEQQDALRFEMFKQKHQTHPTHHKRVIPKSGLTGWVIDTGELLHVQDYLVEQERLPVKAIKLGEEVRSWVGIPLRSQNQVIGVLSLQSLQPRAFNERQIQFLSTLANQLAVALENTRLFQERERRIAELTTLNQMSSTITSTLDLHDLLQRLHSALGQVVDVSTSGIVLYDAERQMLSYPLAYDHGTPVHVEPLPLAQGGVNRWVITHRQPLLLDTSDAAQQYREGAHIRVGANDQTEQSYLVVPIVSGDEVLGVINIQSYAQHAFDHDDLRFVSTVANQAAIAINNARVFQERGRRIEELATFNTIGQELSVLSRVDELVELIYRQTSRLLDTTNFYMALYDERRSAITFPLYYERGERVAPVPGGIEDSLAQLVIQSRAPLMLDEPRIARAVAQSGAPVSNWPKSWLGVPMIASDKITGVIAIRDFERGYAYSQDDVRLLATIASWGAIALEKARLLGEAHQSLREREALFDVSSALAGTLEVAEIVQIVASSAMELLQVTVCAVMLFDQEQRPTRQYVIDLDHPDQPEHPLAGFDDPIIKLLLAHDLPVAVHDLHAIMPDDAPAVRIGLRGSLSALIGPHDKPLGVIVLSTRQPRDWQAREISLISILANQASQALGSARLFEEVRGFANELEQRVEERTAALAELNTQLSEEKERLQTVHAVTLELTESLDLDKTLNKTLQLATKAVNVKRGSIMLRDTQTGILICRAVLGSDGVVHLTHIPINFAHGKGLAGWVMKHQQSVRIPDVQADPRWLHEEGRADEVRSVIAVPLVTQDAPLGVLMLTSPQIDYFSEAQLQLLATIANEIAIVIHNAELHSYIIDVGLENAELLVQQREETSKNQAILQSLGEGVIVLDEQQQVILFNPAAEQMLEIPAAYVLQQPLEQICSYGDTNEANKRAALIYAGLREGLHALNERNQPHNRRIELPAPMQTLELNFAPVIGPANTFYGSVVVLRDVTREIEADRAKRDFISTVSHELRTPLTSIKGYVDLLLLGAAGSVSEGQLAFLSVVKNNANRLMELINDILEIGRIDANKIELSFEQVDIRHILQDVIETMRAEIERKALTVTLDVRDDLPLITADPRRITQVVMNLVSNAVKYTYPNGYLILRSFLNPAGMLEVDVEDNGVGISEDDQKHLFRRFYRTDNPLRDEAGGTGLGLSIAKSFVELHGGEMWVRSEQGQGSTFSFILPATQPGQPNSAGEQ